MGTKRVLYAEDELTNRRLIQIRLQEEGIECDTAADGSEALKLFSSTVYDMVILDNLYDMVILDNYMPVKNGDEVAKEIRKVNPSIPIIGITSDDGSAGYLRSCGFNEVIVKPLKGYASIVRILNYLREDL